MSARGRPLTQAMCKAWAAGPGLIVLCGRFEGVDQRVLDARGFEEVTVGDAVLAGGEAAAMVAIEAIVRLIPGVLGEAASLESESFEDGCSSTRSTPARVCSRGARFRRSCSPAITARSPPSANGRGKTVPASGGPTCGPRVSPINRQRASEAQ